MRDEKLPIGSNKCKCAACGEYFLTVKAFETHRYGKYTDRRCTETADMDKRRLSLDEKGYWRLPKKAFNTELRKMR